jgi:transposase-like protein
MGVAEEDGVARRVRRWRTASEKRRIAELTFEPGASVALGARAHGVNANQLFKWRRALKRGELNEPSSGPTGFVPVMLSAACVATGATGQVDAKEPPAPGGSIHIEFPDRCRLSSIPIARHCPNKMSNCVQAASRLSI